ncbi:MAG: branched-chain amino acid ABC transporter permease [Nitrospinota bacterium]|nr:MAG: branched-chain amino acid ABC transporter permease [Nitrospinota bacterium]
MLIFFQQLINGITLGSFYALIALGYSMVYGILKLINFAHGEIFTAGAYVGLTTLVTLLLWGVNIFVALLGSFLLAMGYSALLGVMIERVAYRPLRASSRITALLSALGMSIFLQNGMMLAQGAQAKNYPHLFTHQAFYLGEIKLTALQLFIIVLTILLMLALQAFIQQTTLGKAMRATSQDIEMAEMLGIDVNKVIALTFLIGSALGGAAGVMVGLYYGPIEFDMGFILGIKAFAAAILGGIGNIRGAMLGGLLLGLIEAMATAYISSEYKDVYAFIMLIAVLYFRPTGLLGEELREETV